MQNEVTTYYHPHINSLYSNIIDHHLNLTFNLFITNLSLSLSLRTALQALQAGEAAAAAAAGEAGENTDRGLVFSLNSSSLAKDVSDLIEIFQHENLRPLPR